LYKVILCRRCTICQADPIMQGVRLSK